MERRKKRFSLHLPMTVRWTTRSGIKEAQTESQDVSSGGIYFFLSKQIEDDSPVEIVMTLPHEVALEGPTRVRCQGRVRRTKVIELKRVGVAAQIQKYDFSKNERRLSFNKQVALSATRLSLSEEQSRNG